MKTCLSFVLLLICLQGLCQNNNNNSKNYSAVPLVRDDSTFLALKDTAQAHLQTFLDSLKIHGRDTLNYQFSVKSDFVENDIHEHMWSLILSYDNSDFKGFFIDSAFDIKNIKTWDKVVIHKMDIEDWSMYNKRTGKTIGYYSEMLLNKKED
ncbi:MAG TPA: DUF2314 domain-containing protein [Mucilaginibacter sp.]|jgi:uncharacterized protein YegJ (DUF2314 family)